MAMPISIYNHHELLTLNTNELPIYENAMAPFFPGVDLQPLFLDPSLGIWVLRVIFHPGVTLPCHYHTGTVHLYTMSGKWMYAEYPDQPQTAGSYLFEPGGSIHTFTTPADNTEPTDTFMVVYGANVNFDAAGNYINMMDANDIMLGIERLTKERGLSPAKYIRPQPAQYSTS